MTKKISINKLFNLTCFIAILLSFLISFFAMQFFIEKELKQEKIILQETTKKTEFIFSASLSSIESMAKYIGEQIVNSGYENNLEKIAKLMGGEINSTANQHNLYITTLFDWVDTDNKMQVSSDRGVLNEPIDMSSREYLKYTKAQPWKLHVQSPAVGIPSGQWIIPAGMGIVDKNNRYIGSVTMGFNIFGIYKTIEDSVNMKDAKILLITNDYKTLEIDNKQDLSSILSKQIKDKSGILSKPIKLDGNEYKYYKKIDKYPYIILSGYQEHYLAMLIAKDMLPYFITFMLLIAIMITTLFFIRNYIVVPINSLANFAAKIDDKSYQKRRFLLYEINKLNRSLVNVRKNILKDKRNKDIISAKKDLLIESNDAQEKFENMVSKNKLSSLVVVLLKIGEIKDNLHKEKDINLLSEIEKDILNISLYGSIEEILDNKAEDTDIYKIINDSLAIGYKKIVPHNIIVNNHIDVNIGTIKTNPIILKKILVSTILNITHFIPTSSLTRKHYITITANYINGILTVTFEDNGIGFDRFEREHIFKISNGDISQSIENNEISFYFIEKLLAYYQGSLEIINIPSEQEKKNKKITRHILTIPSAQNKKQAPKYDNVIDITPYIKSE